MGIEEAVALIRERYEENAQRSWVYNPVAYTLYEVWKIADERKPKLVSLEHEIAMGRDGHEN